MKLLLEHNAEVNTQDDEGWGSLHAVALNRTPEIARLLVQKRADVNLRNGDGNTPLHLAVARLNKPMVEFLLAHGADFSVTNQAGWTAMDVLNGKPLYTGAPSVGEDSLKLGTDEKASRRTQIETMLKAKMTSPGKAE
jgi:hypothetical protein